MTDFMNQKTSVLFAKSDELAHEREGKDCVLLACDVALRQLDAALASQPQFTVKSLPDP